MTSPFEENSQISYQPYWWSSRKENLVSPRIIPEKLDLLVVGAGYTGLSAALAARDLGAKVAVVDAGVAGVGASTRNGGMFGAHPRFGWTALSKKFGSKIADQIFEEAFTAQLFVQNLIKDENIDCEMQNTGRIQLAWTRRDFEKQKSLADILTKKTGIRVSIIDKGQLQEEIKTNCYSGALLFHDHYGLNPMKFHHGLLGALYSRKVPIIERTPILSVRKENRQFLVTSEYQSINVKKVIMATNGYTSGDFKWFQRRVFPLPSFLIATVDLPESLVRELSPRGRMMVETRAQHNYFRPSPDGKKIIFGGRAAMKPINLDEAAKRLKASLNHIWPDLSSYGISHVWTGNTGFSFNQLPNVGEKDGIHYAMGFSGSGTVLAPYLGAKIAYLSLNDVRGKTPYQNTKLKTRAFHYTKKPYFLSFMDFWYRNLVDRWQSTFKK